MSKILITGGLGYIGSHVAVLAMNNKFDITILDNESRCSPRIKEILIDHFDFDPDKFLKVDLLNLDDLDDVFSKGKFDAVIHCAALKSIPESIENPDIYYENNVTGTRNLIYACEHYGVRNLLFSSSCSVYGDIEGIADESMPVKPNNHYSNSKVICENEIRNSTLKHVNLRYFNPIGAHHSGWLGEIQFNGPVSIMNSIDYSALSTENKSISVNGNDYDTKDGTCIRDYIDINDLALAHMRVMYYLVQSTDQVKLDLNVGTGVGVSIMELLDAYSKVNQVKMSVIYGERRLGDIESIYSDVTKYAEIFGNHSIPYTPLTDSVKSSHDWYKKINKL